MRAKSNWKAGLIGLLRPNKHLRTASARARGKSALPAGPSNHDRTLTTVDINDLAVEIEEADRAMLARALRVRTGEAAKGPRPLVSRIK